MGILWNGVAKSAPSFKATAPVDTPDPLVTMEGLTDVFVTAVVFTVFISDVWDLVVSLRGAILPLVAWKTQGDAVAS